MVDLINELDLMIKKHNVKNPSSYDFLDDSDYREFCEKELKEPLNKLVLK